MMSKLSQTPGALIALIAAQAVCAIFFAADALTDLRTQSWPTLLSGHELPELGITFVLVATFVFETVLLTQMLRRRAHLERQVSIASGAFHEIIEAHFADWGLTAAEQDVAHFLIKGCTIPEIAALRGTAEGTVKSHLNGVYRKAGVSGRGALLSLLIDDLMGNSLLPDAQRPETAAAPVPRSTAP